MSFLSERGPEQKKEEESRRGHGRVVSQYAFRECFSIFFRTNYSYTSRWRKFHGSVYIKVGAPKYGSLHLGYAERKGSSSTANRPSAHALIQTRVQLGTSKAVVLFISRAHIYMYTRSI